MATETPDDSLDELGQPLIECPPGEDEEADAYEMDPFAPFADHMDRSTYKEALDYARVRLDGDEAKARAALHAVLEGIINMSPWMEALVATAPEEAIELGEADEPAPEEEDSNVYELFPVQFRAEVLREVGSEANLREVASLRSRDAVQNICEALEALLEEEQQ